MISSPRISEDFADLYVHSDASPMPDDLAFSSVVSGKEIPSKNIVFVVLGYSNSTVLGNCSIGTLRFDHFEGTEMTDGQWIYRFGFTYRRRGFLEAMDLRFGRNLADTMFTKADFGTVLLDVFGLVPEIRFPPRRPLCRVHRVSVPSSSQSPSG